MSLFQIYLVLFILDTEQEHSIFLRVYSTNLSSFATTSHSLYNRTLIRLYGVYNLKTNKKSQTDIKLLSCTEEAKMLSSKYNFILAIKELSPL